MTAHQSKASMPNTEVDVTPSRTWTATQKLALLTEYESYPKGDPRRGAMLRRHGLYSSHISRWRRLRDTGALASLQSRPVGRPPQPRDPLQDEVDRLQQEVARLQAQLQQAEAIIDIQKKLATLLGAMPPAPISER